MAKKKSKRKVKKKTMLQRFWTHPNVIFASGTPKSRNFAQKIVFYFFLVPLVGLGRFYWAVLLFFFGPLDRFMREKKWIPPKPKDKFERELRKRRRTRFIIWWNIKKFFHGIGVIALALLGMFLVYTMSLLLIIGLTWLMVTLFPFFAMLIGLIILYIVHWLSNKGRITFADWQRSTAFHRKHRPNEYGARVVDRSRRKKR